MGAEVYQAHGVGLRVLVDSEALRRQLPALLPHGAVRVPEGAEPEAASFELRAADGERGFRCYAGEELSLESGQVEPVLEQFSRDLMIHVANLAPERVFVHAGVVALGDLALVLPGPSFAGKSTLTAALLRAGATYLSDEYAVVDPEGWVHPYARALQMRGEHETLQHGVEAGRFGAATGAGRYRVGLVVFTEFERGSVWSPREVTPGLALLEMLRHTIPVQRTPARVMSTLAAMLAGATAWTSPRDEADETARALLAQLAERAEATR